MMSSNFDSDSTADPYDWDALARYVSGESDPAEAVAVRAWLDARPERAMLVTALRQRIDGLAGDAAIGVDVEAALSKVHARMAEPAAIPAPRRVQLHRFAEQSLAQRGARRWRVVGSLAAAAAVALTAIGLWRSRVAPSAAAPGTNVITAATYTTSIGQRDSVRLADGSSVILGPASQLVVAARFGATIREVSLRGQAYFDVVHDTTRPFTVHTGNATIVDVGTTFTVRGDDRGTIRVAVTSGAVRLRRDTGADSGVLLAAGDAASLGAGAATVARASVTDDETAFTKSRLVFHDAPLAQVSNDLRRWYGIELRVADSAVASRRLTATFDRETPEQALSIIAAALGATVERHGDTAFVGSARRPLPNARQRAPTASGVAPRQR